MGKKYPMKARRCLQRFTTPDFVGRAKSSHAAFIGVLGRYMHIGQEKGSTTLIVQDEMESSVLTILI